jgi:hypothetical protein
MRKKKFHLPIRAEDAILFNEVARIAGKMVKSECLRGGKGIALYSTGDTGGTNKNHKTLCLGNHHSKPPIPLSVH